VGALCTSDGRIVNDASPAQYESSSFDPKHLVGSHNLDSHTDACVGDFNAPLRVAGEFVGNDHVLVRKGVCYEVVICNLKERIDGYGFKALTRYPRTEP
jgi:hypothetical protein